MQDGEGHTVVAACIVDGLAPGMGSGVDGAAAHLVRRIRSSRSASLQSAAVRFLASLVTEDDRVDSAALSEGERAAAADAVQRIADMRSDGGPSDDVRTRAAEALLRSGRVQRAREACEACPGATALHCTRMRIGAAEGACAADAAPPAGPDEPTLEGLSDAGAAQLVSEAVAQAAAGGPLPDALLNATVERMRASPQAAAAMSVAACALHASLWCAPGLVPVPC